MRTAADAPFYWPVYQEQFAVRGKLDAQHQKSERRRGQVRGFFNGEKLGWESEGGGSGP